MSYLEPVHLQEDETTGARFLIYGSDKGPHVEIHYDGDQLWMTQAQIADLYGRSVSVVSRHISSILEEGELDESNLHKMQIASSTKPVTVYNLDMVISVGYRASSKQATLFRRWATDKLVQFATKGFVIDAPRLKSPDNRDRVKELRDTIRDIRSDEANVYRELRSICAMCQDYDGPSEAWHEFYRITQAKLIFAVCSNTPAELLKTRADAKEPSMGLRTWPNENIRKADVTTSKNYLAEREVEELNRLTTILLDIFEDQLDIGRLKLMAEASALLDQQLAHLGRSVLRGGGRVKMAAAKVHAETEHEKYKAKQAKLRHADADKIIAEIKRAGKALPGK
ncbi:MAG: virulence RhuM family protein [Sphingomonas sp.]|uniref:RhuM family protein n=1 Tax=Sphingomonas sp. TaxID=28214 RepID=UPI0017F93B84|nr:RhuM family protein [Sphingomonas sp.]MBA3667588.1 virulence RhuM family protein [Sphingomonas sp.]